MRAPSLLLAAVGALMLACGQVDRVSSQPLFAAAPLDVRAAENLVLAADDARRKAFAGGGTAPLQNIYTARLIAAQAPRLEYLARRGGGLDEEARERRLVHFAPGPDRAVGVLYVAGVQRPRTSAPVSPGSAFARQWEVQLVYTSGRWLVESAQDLPPERWWR